MDGAGKCLPTPVDYRLGDFRGDIEQPPEDLESRLDGRAWSSIPGIWAGRLVSSGGSAGGKCCAAQHLARAAGRRGFDRAGPVLVTVRYTAKATDPASDFRAPGCIVLLATWRWPLHHLDGIRTRHPGWSSHCWRPGLRSSVLIRLAGPRNRCPRGRIELAARCRSADGPWHRLATPLE